MIGDWTEIIIKLFLTSWVLNSWLKTLLLPNPLFGESKLALFIQSVLLCPKCFSFWITLLITFNPILAAAVSYLMMWSDKLEQSIKTRL